MSNENEIYRVGEKGFRFFSAALAEAKAVRVAIVEIASGRNVWTPAPAPSAKKLRVYRSRLNAYNASIGRPQI